MIEYPDPRRAEFVDRVPGALIFHHPAWLALVCDESAP